MGNLLLNHVVDNVNTLVIGFDDLMICVIMLSVFVTIVVFTRFELRSLMITFNDTHIYSNFEVVWLIRPVLTFVAVGVLSLTISYELIDIE